MLTKICRDILRMMPLHQELLPVHKSVESHVFSIPGFYPRPVFGLRVLSLPASVSVCVCPSVCPSTPSTKFGQKMQNNLVKVPIVLGAIDLNLQSQIWLQNQNSPHFELVRNITQYPFKLGSPNLDQSCKIAWLWSLWFWVAIDLDLQGQIWLKMSNFLVSSLLEIHNHHI